MTNNSSINTNLSQIEKLPINNDDLISVNNISNRRVDLKPPDLQQTGLQQTDLQRTDLQQTDLQQTDIQPPDLQQTDLQQSDLQQPDLQQSDLQQTDLQQPDLQQESLQQQFLQQQDIDNNSNINDIKTPNTMKQPITQPHNRTEVEISTNNVPDIQVNERIIAEESVQKNNKNQNPLVEALRSIKTRLT